MNGIVMIFGCARLSVVAHGITAEDHETDLSDDELRQQISEVGVEVHRSQRAPSLPE